MRSEILWTLPSEFILTRHISSNARRHLSDLGPTQDSDAIGNAFFCRTGGDCNYTNTLPVDFAMLLQLQTAAAMPMRKKPTPQDAALVRTYDAQGPQDRDSLANVSWTRPQIDVVSTKNKYWDDSAHDVYKVVDEGCLILDRRRLLVSRIRLPRVSRVKVIGHDLRLQNDRGCVHRRGSNIGVQHQAILLGRHRDWCRSLRQFSAHTRVRVALPIIVEAVNAASRKSILSQHCSRSAGTCLHSL